MPTFSFSYKQTGASLQQDGALIPVEVTAPVQWISYLREHGLEPFPARIGYALIDTGANRSAVDAAVMSELEIPPVGVEAFLSTHGIADLQLFNLSVGFPELGESLIALKEAPGGVVSHRPVFGREVIMLLGRDLLQRFVFTYDGPTDTITLQA